MGITSLLDAAKNALTAQSLAIQVTGENITNVNTPGYSRQTAVLETAHPTLEHGFPLGNGVMVSTIQRSYDSFLQSQMLAAAANDGEAQTTNSALQTVQPLFNDLNTDGLGKSIQNFFNAWQDLSANPQGVPEREAILSNSQQLVDDFHRINTNLNGVKTNMNLSLEQITTDINDQLNQIAQLNSSIKQTEVGNGNANEMRDQRELLMRQLGQNIGVTFSDLSDGSVAVKLASNGQALVSGNTAASLSLSTNAATGYYDVMLTPAGGGAAVNATSFIGGGGGSNNLGKIGGALAVRDSVVDKYLADLDTLASTVATQVNTVQAAGYGLTTASHGINLFTPPATLTGYSAAIGVNITSTDDVAAANSDPATGGTGNNINAQAMSSLYNKTLTISGQSTTMLGFYNSLVGKVGVDVQNAGRSQTQSGAIVTQLSNQREAVSGVSLDEELVNLTQYQKAYQGAAKVINVGADMMDTVLSLIR